MILNFSPVCEDDHIYRGGQPQDYVDWQFLRSSCGVTQVIKLNTDEEGSDEGALALGISLFKVPITIAQQVFSGPENTDLDSAVGFIVPGTFVHCEHGQDRTGLVIALYRLRVMKWTKTQAEEEMIRLGFHPLLLGLWKAWEDEK